MSSIKHNVSTHQGLLSMISISQSQYGAMRWSFTQYMQMKGLSKSTLAPVPRSVQTSASPVSLCPIGYARRPGKACLYYRPAKSAADCACYQCGQAECVCSYLHQAKPSCMTWAAASRAYSQRCRGSQPRSEGGLDHSCTSSDRRLHGSTSTQDGRCGE